MIEYRVFPWPPQTEMTETLDWLTDIITHVDGSEQRISTRLRPRQSFEVEVREDDPRIFSEMQLAISAGQGRLWGWPCWHEQQRLTDAVPAETVSVAVGAATADYRAGGLALLWLSPAAYEPVEIDAVGDGSISFTAPCVGDFPAGALIMPLRLANISPAVERYDAPADWQKINLTITCLDSVDLAADPSPVQYLGHDVLVDPQLVGDSGMKRAISRAMWTFDPSVGQWANEVMGAYPLITSEHSWQLFPASTSWAFRRWLHRRRGRCVPVWIPSRQHDLVAASTVLSGSTKLVVKDIGYREFGISQPTKQHLALVRADGSVVCRQVTAAQAGTAPGTEELTLNAAPEASDVVRISFLSLHRLAADRIELRWKRAGAAECNASMIGGAA